MHQEHVVQPVWDQAVSACANLQKQSHPSINLSTTPALAKACVACAELRLCRRCSTKPPQFHLRPRRAKLLEWELSHMLEAHTAERNAVHGHACCVFAAVAGRRMLACRSMSLLSDLCDALECCSSTGSVDYFRTVRPDQASDTRCKLGTDSCPWYDGLFSLKHNCCAIGVCGPSSFGAGLASSRTGLRRHFVSYHVCNCVLVIETLESPFSSC